MNDMQKILHDSLRRGGVAPDVARKVIDGLTASGDRISASRSDLPRTSAIHGSLEKYLPDFGHRERRRILDALVAGDHASDDLGDHLSASADRRDENSALKTEAVRTLARFGVDVRAGKVSVHELDRIFRERDVSVDDRFSLKTMASRAGVLAE